MTTRQSIRDDAERISADEKRKADTGLCRASVQCYERLESELEPILAGLEFPAVAGMIEEINHESLCQ
ncbi:hypothetical protein [Zavarzinella formosa]|uniref:hypothetical protein n=1 Tax=Zavarzinella formosa TaxID=360055 RepID=UPI0012FB928C|nr:hypothetical protein [Zavarzinella formosa]